MAQTDEVMITSRLAGGWANAPLTPAALGLVGGATRRRLVTLLLSLTAAIFAGTVVVADAPGSNLSPSAPVAQPDRASAF
jgi:hypothetical protein